jgi:hypothetical protein
MSGNQHPTKRCDTCEFWAPGDQHRYDTSRHEDDREGACHRYAPRPTLGDFEYEVLQHLTIMSWRQADEKQQDEDFKGWEDAVLECVSWPATTGAEWCGDWQKRTHETSGIGWPPGEDRE